MVKRWMAVYGLNFASHKHVQLVKVKVKFTLKQATKAQRGSRGIVLFFIKSRR